MVRSTRILAATLAMTFLPLVCSTSAVAQNKKNQEFIPGTVVSIEKAKTGNNYKMKFKRSDDDEELEVTIGPRTQLLVTAKGDPGFLRPNVVVQTKVVQTNMDFFGKDFTVIIGGNPQGYVKPDMTDKTLFEFSGKVTMTDTTGMMLQCGPQPRKVTFEAEKNVTVKIADAALIKEGDSAEIEGTIVKTKKTMNAVAVNVTSEAEINSDEYFTALEERKKPKSAKSKTSKSKTDAAAGGDADPFGVLKKNKTKGKDDKAEGEDSKKDTEKKDTEKKDSEKKDAEKKDTETKETSEKETN